MSDAAKDHGDPLTCPQCKGDRWIETTTLVETSVGRFVLDGERSLQIEEERPIQDVRTVGIVFHCMSCGLQVTPSDLDDPELYLWQIPWEDDVDVTGEDEFGV